MPPKAAEREGRRHPISFRTTEELREKLEKAASAAGRSLTADIERRLELFFEWERAWGDVEKLKAEFKRRSEEIERGNLEAALHRHGWQNKVTPYGRVWLQPGTSIEPQDQWKYPDEVAPSEATARPIATVDLRALIEETIERVLARLSRPPEADFKHEAVKYRSPPKRSRSKPEAESDTELKPERKPKA